MNRKLIGVLAGAIVVVTAIVRLVPAVVMGGLFDRGPPGWVPTVGTVGQTVTLYSHGLEIASSLIAIVLAVGFGYVLGRRLSLQDEFRPFVRSVAVGVALPALLVVVVAIGAIVLSSFDPYSIVLATLLALRLFVTVSLPVFVGALAGTVLSWFSDGSFPPARGERDPTTTATATE